MHTRLDDAFRKNGRRPVRLFLFLHERLLKSTGGYKDCFFQIANLLFYKYLAALKNTIFMDYSKLVAVTGLSGLFELVSSKADGGVVRSLEDKSTKFVSTRIHNFSHLESIEVFTKNDNVNLVDVFTAMKNSSEVLPADNDAALVKSYFEKVYPDMDFEKVYASDMKKMIKWFGILNENNVEIKLSENPDLENESNDITAKAKPSAVKTSAVNNAPARKINTPRKMA